METSGTPAEEMRLGENPENTPICFLIKFAACRETDATY